MGIGKVAKWLWYCTAAFIIFAATVVSISRLFTPLLNQHRADFEHFASELLNTSITIGQIRISWETVEPQLIFEKVVIFSQRTHKPTFQVQKVKINLNILRSVLNWQPIPERIIIKGLHVTLRQQKSGKVNVEGLEEFAVTDNFTGASVEANEAAGWIFSQRFLALDDVDVRYIPATGQSSSITLNQLSLNNNKGNHSLSGQAVLNQEVPTAMTVGIEWTGEATDLKNISANIYLYVEAISLPQWFSQQTWHHLRIKQGLGSAKIWARWDHEQLQKVQTRFQFYEIQVQSLLTHKLQVISRLSGHVGWKRQGNSQVIAGEDILIDFPQHLWPTTHFSAILAPDAQGMLTLQAFSMDYLDLADSKEVALASGLLSTSTQKVMTGLNPIGEVRALNMTMPSPLTDFDQMVLSAKFSEFSCNEFEKIPGITYITGTVAWDGKQGKLKLNGQNTSISFHSIFANTLTFERLAGTLNWQKNNDNTWLFDIKNIKAVNADIKTNADVNILVSKENAPSIDLSADFSVLNARNIQNYLPLKILEPDLIHWLKNAFQRGEIVSGKAILQGSLRDFPFDNKAGKFLVSGTIKDLDLNYAPHWPQIQHINGILTFSGSSMMVDVDSGQIYDMQISQVHAMLPQLGGKGPSILNLQAAIHGDLAQGLRFIHESPLQTTLGQDLAGLSVAGPMQLKINLSVPVAKTEETKVQGDLDILNVSLKLPAWDIAWNQVQGALHFTQDEVHASNLKGNLFGELAVLNLNTISPRRKTAFIKADLQSTINIAALEKWLHVPLTRYAQGATAYKAELHLISHRQTQPTQIKVRSDLKGIMIDLPKPYGKEKSEVKKIQVDISATGNRLVQAKLIYDNLFNATLTSQKSKQGIRSLMVNLKSSQVAGELIVPLEQSDQPLQAKFQRLYIPAIQGGKSLLDPKTLPALSFSGNDVRYKDKKLGRLALELIPSQSGSTIKFLQMSSSKMKLTARGHWELQNKNYHTHLQGEVVSNNVSALLNYWGLQSTNLVDNGGAATFDLTWPDAPYHPTIIGMLGTTTLKLNKGRVVDVGSSNDAKMGLGRLLSVLNLQTIPRRLSLDFSDIFEEGYSFDSMKGSFEVKNGDAFTKSTRFDGPAARIEISGRVGLAAKDFAIYLSVTPYVTSSLPVVGAAIAGTPIAGVAVWAVDRIVNKTVSNFVTYQYSVTGTWDAPVWKEVDRK